MNYSPQIPFRFDGRGNRLYFPGETLAGSYFLNDFEDETIEAVEASVLWHTEGKGNEDFGIFAFQRKSVAQGDWIDPRTPGRIGATLPNSPLSYEGELVKIFWAVRIRVFLADGREAMDEHPFRLGNIANIRTFRALHQKNDGRTEIEEGKSADGPIPAASLHEEGL